MNPATPAAETTPATPTASVRPPPWRSPFASVRGINSAAAARPKPLRSSLRAMPGGSCSGRSSSERSAGSVSSSGRWSCSRLKYSRAESPRWLNRLNPVTSNSYRPGGASRPSPTRPSHCNSRGPSLSPAYNDNTVEAPVARSSTRRAAAWVESTLNVRRSVRGSIVSGVTGRTPSANVRRFASPKAASSLGVNFSGSEIEDSGVGLAPHDQRRPEVLIGEASLLLGHDERGVGRDDPAQDGDLTLDVQLRVIVDGAIEHLCRGALGRAGRGHAEQQCHQSDAGHGTFRRAMRPSRVVPPGCTTNVVSTGTEPGALIRRCRLPAGTSTSNRVPTPACRSSM